MMESNRGFPIVSSRGFPIVSSRSFPIVGPHNHFRRGLLKAGGPEILFGTKFLVNLHPKEGYSIVAETLSFAEAFIGTYCIMARM